MSYLVESNIKPYSITTVAKKIYYPYSGSAETRYISDSGAKVGTYYEAKYERNDFQWGQSETFCTYIKYSPEEFTLVEPKSAQNNRFEIRFEFDVKTYEKLYLVVFTKPVKSSEEIYDAMYDTSSTKIATLRESTKSISISISGTNFTNLVSYGVGLRPVSQADSSGLPNETDTYYYYNYITSLSEVHNYENKYAPGSVIVLSPIAHSVLLTNSDNIVTFTYNHAFGQPMKNLGVKLTNLTTGDIDQLYKRYSVDFADGANGSFTIPSGSLSDGTYKIDISAMPDGGLKYFDADDPVWTTGTSVEYIVKTRADVSGDITCDGKPVPTITWSSSGQSVYQVRFGDYDSGAKIGTASSYTVPMVFTDGNYAAQVRTANSFGEWGSWTDIDYVSVTNIPISGNILLSVEKFGNNILLSWLTTVSDPDNYAVFRDGKMIAVVYDTSYMDIYGNGDVEYQVLAMKNKYYAASNVVMFSAILPWDVISYDGGVTYQLLKYTPATKTQNENINTEVTYAYYAGRAKPISVSSNQKTRIKNFTYIFKNRSNATEIIAKEGTPALIKTTRGAIIYGIVHEMNLTDSKYPIVSFSIREIDREGERVEYPV